LSVQPPHAQLAYVKPEPRHVRAQSARLIIDEIRQPSGAAPAAFNQDNMQADAQSRKARAPLNRVRSRGAGDHQACGREDPALIAPTRRPALTSGASPKSSAVTTRCSEYGLAFAQETEELDSLAKPPLQHFGLRTISPTIEAIFGARK